MQNLNRRDLLNGVLWSTAAAALPQVESAERDSLQRDRLPWHVIDTNINLFQWPFRRLPFDTVPELIEKLRSLQIDQAWAGSYEGVLQRDLAGVNLRLTEACRKQSNGLLLPFGSVNPQLPDWRDDLRRCHEEHHMQGIRLHPNYHGYTLDVPEFAELLTLAKARGFAAAVGRFHGRRPHTTSFATGAGRRSDTLARSTEKNSGGSDRTVEL